MCFRSDGNPFPDMSRSGVSAPMKTNLCNVARAVLAGLALLSAFAAPAKAERIKDLASIAGVRSNALIGHGLVVGLDGTRDQTTQTLFTTQSLATMLSQLGITLPPGQQLQLK